MKEIKLISIKKSNDGKTKLTATFEVDGKIKKVRFGAKGMSDYTIHKNDERRDRYIARHKKNENWNDPLSKGALSRWILWNKKNLNDSIEDYKLRFNL